MHRFIAVLTALLTLAAAAGCTSGDRAEQPKPSVASTPTDEPSESPQESPGKGEPSDAAPSIGESFVTEDGISIQLVDIRKGKIDSDDPGTEFKKGKPCIYLTVKVDNGSTSVSTARC